MFPVKLDKQYDHLPAFERVTNLLRDEMIAGKITVGQTLGELELSERLESSRNTIREALRQLLCEGLVDYQRNKGVTVRRLEYNDVKDIYTVRRTLELQALLSTRDIKKEILFGMEESLNKVEAAVAVGNWTEVATNSLRFHQSIVSILGSQRFDSFFATIIAQLRLLFANAPDEKYFQQPWVEKDRDILNRLLSGDRQSTSERLALYLDESEQKLLKLYNQEE
ncbi:GntR family transcriptional regulator [Psychromonas arctica]|uniref:GntR family transcriptional regulator n=1 Tax=Psychromonas arctica TaxID=168275 RepID=A0ABU9HBV9_9GAMM